MENSLDFKKWENLIGKLILSCTRVEYELMNLYELWLPKRNFDTDNYESRFDKAIGIAKKRLGEKDPMINQLINMKSYSKYRHIVAHNPIHYSNVFKDWRILDLKKKINDINIEKLEKIANDAEINSIKLSQNLRIKVQ